MKPKSATSLLRQLPAVIALVCAGAALLQPAATAATIYWDGTGSSWGDVGSWSTALGTWLPNPAAVPGTSDDAIFSVSTLNTAQTVNLNGDRSLTSLVFLGTNPATTTLLGEMPISTLTLAAGSISVGNTGNASNSIAGAVTIGSATSGQKVNITLTGAQTWTTNWGNSLTVHNNVSNGGNLLTFAGAGTTTINGVIGNGAGGITKDSTSIGTTILTGANSYTGATINQCRRAQHPERYCAGHHCGRHHGIRERDLGTAGRHHGRQ